MYTFRSTVASLLKLKTWREKELRGTQVWDIQTGSHIGQVVWLLQALVLTISTGQRFSVASSMRKELLWTSNVSKASSCFISTPYRLFAYFAENASKAKLKSFWKLDYNFDFSKITNLNSYLFSWRWDLAGGYHASLSLFLYPVAPSSCHKLIPFCHIPSILLMETTWSLWCQDTWAARDL